MDESFIRTKLALEQLRELGYTEVWIGRVPNPHWDHGMSNGVVAAPRLRVWNQPALWTVCERNFGPKSCGNGLREADQMQFGLVDRMLRGHYVLKDGCWFPEEMPHSS